MEKKDLIKYFISGVFLIVGVMAIFFFIFTVGKDKGLSQPKFEISVLFRDVGGLSEGAPVRLNGVNVGNVGAINFLEKDVKGRKVEVKLNIYSKFKKVLEDSTEVTIKTEGVLGEKLVEIYTIENAKRLNLTMPVIGIDPLDFGDLATVFSGAAESFQKTAEELGKVDMVELTEVMKDSSAALLITAEGLNAIMNELDEIARKAKRLIDRIEQKVIEGELFKVF